MPAHPIKRVVVSLPANATCTMQTKISSRVNLRTVPSTSVNSIDFLDGTLTRNGLIHVQRGGANIADAKCDALKRFTDDVREVQSGYECGISLDGFNDIKDGDVFEFYHKERNN